MKYDLAALERAARIRKMGGFKLIIAGTRDIEMKVAKKLIREHWKAMCKAVGAKPDYIISGGQRAVNRETGAKLGVDYAGELIAKEMTGREAVVFPANWDLLGKSADPSRNLDMVSVANALFIIWDGKSPGSRHVLGCMEIRQRPIFEIEIER